MIYDLEEKTGRRKFTTRRDTTKKKDLSTNIPAVHSTRLQSGIQSDLCYNVCNKIRFEHIIPLSL